MKKIIYVLLATSLISACANNDKKANAQHDSLVKKAVADTSNFTTIQWLDTMFNFGTVKQGEKVSLKYR